MAAGEINSRDIEAREQTTRTIDWFKMPYPAWLRVWLDDETSRLRNSGRFNTWATAKAEAKKLISDAVAEHGIPPDYLEDKEIDPTDKSPESDTH